MNDLCKAIQNDLDDLLPVMKQVYSFAYQKEIQGENVPNDEKIFSIFEQHTDIIVKSSRDVLFGHKINLATGHSNLILDITTEEGNPSDKNLYKDTIDRVISNYETTPRDIVTDGGYATKENMAYTQKNGVINVVFNKIVGSLVNKVTSKSMGTRLKKWRSGIFLEKYKLQIS